MSEKGNFNFGHFVVLMIVKLVPALLFAILSRTISSTGDFWQVYAFSCVVSAFLEIASLRLSEVHNKSMDDRFGELPRMEPEILDFAVIFGSVVSAIIWPRNIITMPYQYWAVKDKANYGLVYFLVVTSLVLSIVSLFVFMVFS